MKEKEIMKLNSEEIDEELFRELSCSWEKKDLINQIIDNMNIDDKRNWILEYFEGNDEEDEEDEEEEEEQLLLLISKFGVIKMEQDKINQSIGELLCKAKYKFIPSGLVGEICREFVEEYEKEEKD